MAVVIGRRWRGLMVAPASLLSVLGLVAVPAARASQPGQAARASQASQAAPGGPRLPAWPAGSRPDAAGQALAPAAGRSLWRPGLLAGGGVLPKPASPASGAGAGGWSVVPTPNPARLRNGSLAAESCTGPSACTAVGSSVNATGTTVTMAQRWDGASWRVQPTPEPAGAIGSVLTGVSCASALACTAVGYYFDSAGDVRTLAEAWNGARWLIQASPSPAGLGSGFFAVSCTSARACTAVGLYNDQAGTSLTLAERWDGVSWSIQATLIRVVPLPSALFGVSCSAASACTAVGSYDDSAGTSLPLAMAWDGSTWTSQAAPSPAKAAGSGLSAVSCTSPAACTATGSYFTASGGSASLAERWNGAGWAIQAVPSPHGAQGSDLAAVSCASARACVAAGAYLGSGGAAGGGSVPGGGSSGSPTVRTLAESWNGSAWRVLAAANPARSIGAGLNGVSCPAPRACSAAGSYSVAASPASLTTAQSWNGTTWRLHATPSPAGANASEFTADSCASARRCAAVGFYARTASVVATLAEAWDGAGWRIQPTPNPAGATSSGLFAVSCSAPRACTAVGTAGYRSGRQLPLAEAWNGTRWTIQSVPVPAGGAGISLNSVSCSSPRACTAVGFYDSRSGVPVALAERWDGAAWRIQSLPKAARRTWLWGVSCPSAAACTAVGYLNNGTANARPLAEAWDGTSWRAAHVPLPAGNNGGAFRSVSCASADACTATGAAFNSTGAPLAESWNGTSWSAQPTVAPLNYQLSTSEVSLTGVSCSSASACAAVGGYSPNNAAESFAEAWDGAAWTLQITAASAGTQQSILDGVSCGAGRCLAVGASIGPSGAIVTMAESRPG